MTTSPLLKAVLESSWQGSLVILLILAIRPLLGLTIPARWRSLLWLLALLRLLVPAFLLPPSPTSLQNFAAVDRPLAEAGRAFKRGERPTTSPSLSASRLAVDAEDTESLEAVPLLEVPTRTPWWRFAATLWVAGFALTGLWILGGTIRLHRRLRRDSLGVDAIVREAWERCCARVFGNPEAFRANAQQRRLPQLIETSAVSSPALVGVWRPLMLIPRNGCEDLSQEDWEHILLHELAHFRRRDHWLNALQLVALCVHWFNPLVWLGFRSLRTDRELAADEWALQRLSSGRTTAYGETLMKLLTTSPLNSFAHSTVGILEDGTQMKTRLRRIVAFGPRRWSGAVFGASVGLLLVTIVLGRQLDPGLVCDRHGVALVKAGEDRQHPQFPFGALAPQVLLALQSQTGADASKPLELTIDARIQFITERALRAVPRGAAVVIDPRDGSILAMASVPSFDPNTLDEKTRAALDADATRPRTNRALSAFSPGAAFLPVTGLAGLRKGLADTTYKCAGGVMYGDKYMKCLSFQQGGHGELRLEDAMKVSCNAFFYQYGNAAGIEEIEATAKLLGLGSPSGLPLGEEDAGIVPGPDWLQKVSPKERWSFGYTANVAIGQGALETTPLQLAMAAATIGNGGQAYAPRLLLKEPARLRANLLTEGWTTESIERVRRGMWKTLNESGGTRRRARVPGVAVAGRTGTAQAWRENNKENHTWFLGFAPYDKPTLAICVLVEGAKSGGGVAAPIAGRILTEALASDSEPRVEVLKPAVGNFDLVREPR